MAAYQDNSAILEKMRQGQPLTEQERRQLVSLSAGGGDEGLSSKNYQFKQQGGIINQQQGGEPVGPPGTSKEPGGGLIGGQTGSITGTKMGQSTPVGTETNVDWGEVMSTVEDVGSFGKKVAGYFGFGLPAQVVSDLYGVAKMGYNAINKEVDPDKKAEKEAQFSKELDASLAKTRAGMSADPNAKGGSLDTGQKNQGGFQGLGIGNPSSYGGKSLGEAAASEMSGGNGGEGGDKGGSGPGEGHGMGGR